MFVTYFLLSLIFASSLSTVTYRIGRSEGFDSGDIIGKSKSCDTCYQAGKRSGYRQGAAAVKAFVADAPEKVEG